MRRFLLALAVLAAWFPGFATAQTISTGQSLRERCATVQLINPSAGLHCRGYIGAVADILAGGDTVAGYRACPPAEISREELVRSVKAWLDKHSERLQPPAFRLAARALSESFPCAEKQ